MGELDRIENYFGAMPQAFCVLELICDAGAQPRDFRFLYLNDAMGKLMNLPREQVEGQNFYSLYPTGDKKWLRLCTMVAGQRVSCTMRKFHSAELGKYLRTVYYPWPGGPFCAVLLTDETELVETDHRLYQSNAQLQQAEKELKAACAQAEKANAAKTGFLSSVSHDMRTPLNGIVGYTTLALQAKKPERMREYLEKIQSSSKLLLELINNTLDLNKIETGAISLNPEPVSERQLLEQVKNAIQVSMDQKQIQFVVDTRRAVLTNVQADVLRLREIIMNLLSNAIKFTPRGGRIDLVLETREANENFLHNRITVRDSGCGISEAFMPYLFDPYTQEVNPAYGHAIGTGLGLSIVKKLVELMGGHIRVQSEVGAGTEFQIDLKLERAAGDFAPEEKKTAVERLSVLHGKRVLLCEDNEINREIAVALLEQQEIKVVTAENGRQGVQIFMDSDPYELAAILMDEQMPVMDGFTAARKIRAMARPDAQTIPILAVTGNAYDEDVKRTKAAGMDAHITKPLDPEQLYEVLAKFMQ